MPYAALTGNFGSGKSTVLSMFEELGAKTIDADALVSAILREEPVIKEISSLLGTNVVRSEGTLDKKKLSSIIFENPSKRHMLENLIHPRVFERAEEIKRAHKANSSGTVTLFEVPLLFERGYSQEFDKVIVTYCDREKSVKRLISRGFERQESLKRIKAQMAIEEKVKQADYVIDNTGEKEKTRAQVVRIYRALLLFK